MPKLNLDLCNPTYDFPLGVGKYITGTRLPAAPAQPGRAVYATWSLVPTGVNLKDYDVEADLNGAPSTALLIQHTSVPLPDTMANITTADPPDGRIEGDLENGDWGVSIVV